MRSEQSAGNEQKSAALMRQSFQLPNHFKSVLQVSSLYQEKYFSNLCQYESREKSNSKSIADKHLSIHFI